MMNLEEIENVKIVKKCEPIVKHEDKSKTEEIPCEDFKFDETKNFLETVDKEVKYFDDSIKYEDPNVVEEAEKPPPICFVGFPKKLSEQISLPFDNFEELSFYESFIINENDRACMEDNQEIGSATTMVEELDDGNILVFTTQQTFINNERICQENLSVVTKDLQLIHEKRIETKCNAGTFTVCLL